MHSLFLHYYRSTFIYNFIFSALVGFVGNFFICFCTFGSLVSFIAYQYHKGHEYYFYYNYGYTKAELMLKTMLANVLFSFILYLFVQCSKLMFIA
ncbi:MAG: hypothetical protein JNL75_00015 [Chitinophagales bacterium]|nr:hypothetical protein [Chitinophagales bacterium]